MNVHITSEYYIEYKCTDLSDHVLFVKMFLTVNSMLKSKWLNNTSNVSECGHYENMRLIWKLRTLKCANNWDDCQHDENTGIILMTKKYGIIWMIWMTLNNMKICVWGEWLLTLCNLFKWLRIIWKYVSNLDYCEYYANLLIILMTEYYENVWTTAMNVNNM